MRLSFLVVCAAGVAWHTMGLPPGTCASDAAVVLAAHMAVAFPGCVVGAMVLKRVRAGEAKAR